MKVLDLRCAREHPFEGWFASEEDFAAQRERGLVGCPLCGETSVTRLPSAPRLNVSRAREPQPAPSGRVPGPAAPEGAAVHAAWLQAVRRVLSSTVDVGERFPEEARRIHYGEAHERPIRGRATPDEAQALRDEGIEVVAIPVPDALKGPVQ